MPARPTGGLAVEDVITLAVPLEDAQAADVPMSLRCHVLRIERTRQVLDGPRESGARYRSTDTDTDAECIANDALAAL